MSDLINILALVFLGSIISLVGGVVFLYNKSWSGWLSSHSIPFAAGVLITVSLVSLLPESVHMIGERAYLVLLISFLCAYLFENFFFSLHHHNDDRHKNKAVQKSVPLVILGDTIHNFIDGIAIAASFITTPGLGLITAISTFLHEVPHEIGDFGILLKAGWSRRKTFCVNLVSAMASVLGALFVVYLVDDPGIIGVFMAIAAGLFLYLGASDFLPHIHEEDLSPTSAVISLLVGSLIMLSVTSFVPHSHEADLHTESEEILNVGEDH